MKTQGKSTRLLIAAGFGLVAIGQPASAKITGSLVVHNSRSDSITVQVYDSQGRYVGEYAVDARSRKSIEINDTEAGMDWFDAYDSQGYWLKRGTAEGSYANFDWYVD